MTNKSNNYKNSSNKPNEIQIFNNNSINISNSSILRNVPNMVIGGSKFPFNNPHITAFKLKDSLLKKSI